MLTRVQKRFNEILFERNRLEGNRLVKEGEFVKALEYYEKCLRITRKATSLNNIGVFVNKTACIHNLGQYSRVITECNNALRLTKNFKNQ